MITMSQKELKRLHIIRKVIEQTLTQIKAGEILGLCTRQVRRILKKVRQGGDRGIVHETRGKPSNNQINPKTKEKALKLYQTKYPDFGPTLATEKLREINKIKISDETLRRWLIDKRIPYKIRKPRPHRRWRPRKECFGQMLQMDGSHHDWLEGRGPWLVLMAYKDDAQGEVFAKFYDYEGTLPALDGLKGYIDKYGIPQSIYLDKHTTYKSPAKPTIEDELNDRAPLSQFAKACQELGITLIYAHSPQAKGRIERQFRTFQDRLIKELRLKGAKTLKAANEVLEDYLPVYNKRFRITPASKTDLHRPLPQGLNLNSIFCIKEKRVLRNDFTISYESKLYQVTERLRAKTLTVREHLDGSIRLYHNEKPVLFEEIKRRLKRKTPRKIRKPRVYYQPTKYHPWKRLPAVYRYKAA